MTAEEKYTKIEQRLVDLRSDGDVDQADVEALLESSDSVDKQAGLKALVLTETDEYDCFDGEIPSLTPYLTDEDPTVRYNALRVAMELVPEREELLRDAPAMIALLDDDSDHVADTALDAMSVLVRQDATAVRDATDEVAVFLDSKRSEIRKRAVRYLTILVQERPADAIPVLDRLVAMIGETYEMPEFDTDDWRTPMAHTQTRQDVVSHGHEERARYMTIRELVAEVLLVLARECPDSVLSYGDTLREYLSHSDPHVRRQTLRVFTALAEHRPSAAVDVSEEAMACVDADKPDDLSAVAILLLGMVVSEAPSQLFPELLARVDRLGAFLDHDDPHVRGTALGLLSHVADRDPAAAGPVAADVIELLDDGHSFVRGNAVWTLRYLATDEAASALRDRLGAESDEAVRRSVERALEVLESPDEGDGDV